MAGGASQQEATESIMSSFSFACVVHMTFGQIERDSPGSNQSVTRHGWVLGEWE
jgi:hypothetical protein